MGNIIKHDNIIYIRDFSELGGVETFTFELAKKYKDLDIAVVYKSAHKNQVKRIRKYCRAYQHFNQKIECKVAIINYDVSIIDYINEDAKIYQVVHGDYENSAYTWKPPTHERIYKYLGITKHIVESFKRITGLKNVELCYNPLTIEKNTKKLVLISMTRLSKIKGKDRMIKLANELDLKGINYIWYVFTNDINAINSPHVVYMKPRLDVSYWLEQADYLIQLSDTEACSYSINEALYRNIPVIVTPLPYLEEIGVKDNKNAYILEFDCSNVPNIVDKINNVPKFNFEHLKDNYNNILAMGKSHYEEDLEMKIKVRAIKNFTDLEEVDETGKNIRRIANKSEWICNKERSDYLLEHKAIEVVEEIKEEVPKVKVEVNIDSKKVAEKVIEVQDKPKSTKKKKSSKK